MTQVLIALIRVYQATLSRLLLAAFGPVCRFEPSCSRYAVACLAGHGALRGSLLSVRRLCKCHPFHPGGFDPPPPPRSSHSSPGRAALPTPEPAIGQTPGPAGAGPRAPVTMGETPKPPAQPALTPGEHAGVP